MKISVIVPVYNGQETIARCLEALAGQDYLPGDFDVVVVNDGSEDDTLKIAERYPVRLINLEKNQGRIIARERGAKEACYDNLLFVDSRVVVARDILARIARINYQPLMAGELGEDKYRSPFDTLFYLIRKKIYAPYYPQHDWGRELWIDQDNFGRAPKGMTCFFCTRNLFLQSIPQVRGKTVNDDTRILHAMVKHKRLLRHTDLRIAYLQRTEWRSVLGHIFERGVRFADYYLDKKGKYYQLWRVGLVLFIAILSFSYYLPFILLYSLLGLCLGLLWWSLILSENLKDFVTALSYFPLVGLTFLSGIIKGKLFHS